MNRIILNILKSPIFWIVILSISLIVSICLSRAIITKQEEEINRLEINQQTLIEQVEYYIDENGYQVATIQALSLKQAEFESLMPQYTNEIERLRIKIKNLQSVAHVSSKMSADINTPLVDYIPRAEMEVRIQEIADSLEQTYNKNDIKYFQWDDGWLSISGNVSADSVMCNVTSRDSLTLIAHRERRRCLFKRKGKIIRYDVKSANPHTIVDDIQYIEIVE